MSRPLKRNPTGKRSRSSYRPARRARPTVHSCPARWFSSARGNRSRCRTIRAGGASCRARTGVIRRDRRAASKARTIIPWCRCRSRMRKPTRNGSASVCRSKPNGSSRRAAVEQATYAWGDQFSPDGRQMAKVWQGQQPQPFPVVSAKAGGAAGTSRVESFPANGYGLYDMTGNAWQWTADWYRVDQFRREASAGGVVNEPTGPADSWGSGRSRRARAGAQARHARRLVPLQRSVLLELSPERAARHRSVQQHVASGFSSRHGQGCLGPDPWSAGRRRGALNVSFDETHITYLFRIPNQKSVSNAAGA